MLKLGFTIYSNPVQDFVTIAKHAEALGFERVWIGEHIVAPVSSDISQSEDVHKGRARPPVVASDNRFFDLWTMVGAIAASTTKLHISTGIAVLPYRHPLATARAALTADALTAGRFSLGVAAGWLESEFDALGVPFKRRGALTNEGMDILRKIFAGGLVDHEGPAYPFPKLQMNSQAVDIPILVGGVSPSALARAATKGDGWIGPKLPFEKFLTIREEIDRIRAEVGRDQKRFDYHMHMPSADPDVVRQWEDAGFEYGVVVFDDIHPEDPRETSIDEKLRCLDATAKKLKLQP